MPLRGSDPHPPRAEPQWQARGRARIVAPAAMARYSKAFRARDEPSVARVYPDVNTNRCEAAPAARWGRHGAACNVHNKLPACSVLQTSVSPHAPCTHHLHAPGRLSTGTTRLPMCSGTTRRATRWCARSGAASTARCSRCAAGGVGGRGLQRQMHVGRGRAFRTAHQ